MRFSSPRLIRSCAFLPAAAVIIAGLAGCARTTQHGDAILKTGRALIGPEGHRVWSLELPVVDLTREGQHYLRVRGLPRIAMSFDLLMIVPEAGRGEQNIGTAPWRDTSVAITVRSVAGATLGESSYRLGQLFGSNGFGVSYYEDLPEVTHDLPIGGDDLIVLVEHPSTRRGDRCRIRASATTNDLGR